MKQILVYGSLREGCYNHTRFKRNAEKNGGTLKILKSNIILDGYTMVSLGSYPAIIPSLVARQNKIVVDLIEVDDTIYDSICNMETKAGYAKHHIHNMDADIFVYVARAHNNYTIVEDGNWLNSTSKF